MRALSNVFLPRVAQNNEHNKAQSERSNESRLNSNFKIIQGAVAELELKHAEMDSRINAIENAPVGTEISEISDNVLWRVVEVNTGDLFASEQSNEISLNFSFNIGSLYTADTKIIMPSGFSSVSSVFVTVESKDNPIFATVTSFNVSEISVSLVSPVSGFFTFRLHVFITGKATA